MEHLLSIQGALGSILSITEKDRILILANGAKDSSVAWNVQAGEAEEHSLKPGC